MTNTKHRKNALWVALVLFSAALGGVFGYAYFFRTPADSKPVPVLGQVSDFSLTDQDGKELGLSGLLGKNWIASFIFTRCGATCPAQAKSGSLLQQKLKDSPHGDQVRLVFISVDPENDTPSVLREYATRNGASEGFWHFLTGPIDDVLDLSIRGFKLPASAAIHSDTSSTPTHSSQFALVDARGQIRGYYDGVSLEAMDDLVTDLNSVMTERTSPVKPFSEAAARRDPTQQFDSVLDGSQWLQMRQKEQLKSASTWQVFHDFKFADRLYQTDINFKHRIVDDAASKYKSVHYDHGTGIAVADVDGDQRYDIFFVNQVGANQLWRNLGDGKFEDITAKAGVGIPQPIKVAASFADVNNDGSADLYVTTVRGGNRLFLNDGKGNFSDQSKDSGIDLVGHFSAPVFFDYDRDGLVDLFLCEVGTYSTDEVLPVTTPIYPPAEPDSGSYHYFEGFPDAFSGHLHPERDGRCLLLRNMGKGRFEDVTADVGLNHKGWTGDATPIDANVDGWPDLYVLSMQGIDEYYENQAGRTFIRKTAEVFNNTPWGAMGSKVFDYNNDGKFDLLVTDMHSDMSTEVAATVPEEKRKSQVIWPETFVNTNGTSIFGNALYEGLGPNQFTEVSDAMGIENYWPWGPSVNDLNADGYQDIFITAGMSFPYRYAINSVLLNEGGKRFVDSEFVVGVEPRRGKQTAMPWYEGETETTPEQRATTNLRTVPVTVWSSLSSRSSVIFDVDDDGDLDIVTNEFNAPPLFLVSNLSERKKIHFLKIRLIGGLISDTELSNAVADNIPAQSSNRQGLGAIVRVKCGSNSYWQVHDGKSGYLSQSDLPLYFGLGDAEKVDEIEVVWPSGKKSLLGATEANQLITITEP